MYKKFFFFVFIIIKITIIVRGKLSKNQKNVKSLRKHIKVKDIYLDFLHILQYSALFYQHSVEV